MRVRPVGPEATGKERLRVRRCGQPFGIPERLRRRCEFRRQSPSRSVRDIPTSAGRVSHELAQAHADAEFERYQQRESASVESDFDRFSKRVIERGTEPEVES